MTGELLLKGESMLGMTTNMWLAAISGQLFAIGWVLLGISGTLKKLYKDPKEA